MIIRALLSFLSISASNGASINGCENDSQLSVESKSHYERALSLCVTDSDSYRTTISGAFEERIHISKCQFQQFFNVLYPTEDVISLTLQASAIFKVLDQSYGPHLSLCDIIFGAEKLMTEFTLLQSVFGETAKSVEEITSIYSLANMVDKRCDLDCRCCPKSLCVTKEACAYNIHLGCFSTGQPTLTPTDPTLLVNSDADKESSVIHGTQTNGLTWSQNTIHNEPIEIETENEVSPIYTEVFLCLSLGMWVALVVYLIRKQQCRCQRCRLCSYHVTSKIPKNMDEMRRVGEFSEGEVSECCSTVQTEEVDCEGGTRGATANFPRTRNHIYLGGSSYAYSEKEPLAPGEAQPCCFVKSKKASTKPTFQSKISHAFETNSSKDSVFSQSSTDGKLPVQKIYPPVVVKNVAKTDSMKSSTGLTSSKAFQLQRAVPPQRVQVQVVSQQSDIGSNISMGYMNGVKASSDEDSGYGS
jgi:hypothetical protein